MGTGTAVRSQLHAAAHAVRPSAAQWWRRELLRRATDETDAAAGRSCLVLAPHPDDETLGAGALIARKRAAGTRVRVLVVTDGRRSHVSRVLDPDALAAVRRAESERACAVLGVPDEDLVHLELPEGTVEASQKHVGEVVADELGRLRPDDVLVTSELDWHVDHRALAAVARRVVTGRPGVRLLEYPVWAWADGPWSDQPGRSPWQAARALVTEPLTTARAARPLTVRADPELLLRKRQALAQYASQTTNLTGEPGWAVMDQALLDRFLQPQELFLTTAPAVAA
jgi:LmbE family N-acetylglucosaminyl deacetylase